MSTKDNDLSKKIEYAEQWLQKAKIELATGSTVSAASHVILAIAEMETLKNAIFGIEKSTHNMTQPIKRARRFDIRPLLAAAMFLIALSIFTFAPRNETSLPIPDVSTDTVRFETLIGSLSERNSSIYPPSAQIELPSIFETEPSDENPISPKIYKPSATKTTISKKNKSDRSVKSESHYSIGVKEEISPSSIAIPSRDYTPVSAELDTTAISLEAILVARESLNSK